MILIIQELDCEILSECYGATHDYHKDNYKILYACDNFQQVREFLAGLDADKKIHGDLEWQIWRNDDKEPFRVGTIRKEEVTTYKYTIKDEED